MYAPGHTPTHAGRITTTLPFSKLEDIAAIKAAIHEDPRDFALFVFAINSGFRASDIVKLRRSDLQCLDDGRFFIEVREKKTKRIRRITLNKPTTDALVRWLNVSDGEFVFETQRGCMTVSYFGRLVKSWAAKIGMSSDQRSTHSLRKTFVRVNLEHHKVPLTTLQWMLNHESPAQTLVYAGLTPDDAQRAYANEI